MENKLLICLNVLMAPHSRRSYHSFQKIKENVEANKTLQQQAKKIK